MKKAIGGLIFDTDTATVLARSSDGDILYRTQNGRYFRCSQPIMGDPEITVLTSEQALCLYNRCVAKLAGYEEAFENIDFRPA